MRQADYDAARAEAKERAAVTIAENAEAAKAAKQEALASASVNADREAFLARAKRIEAALQGAVEEAEEAQDANYEDLTNDQLKELLKERDLPVSGNKDELVARLRESDTE